MKVAFFDCFSGVSGDMVLAALMHLGVPQGFLEENLGSLPLEGFKLEVEPAERMCVHGLKARVVVPAQETARRDYQTIRALIEESSLEERVKTFSLKAFRRLAEAEGAVHKCATENVHFHELGGVDAIADIVGTGLGLAWLEVEKIFCSELPVGRGFVQCSHGTLPVPAPATMALLQGAPVYGTGVPHELVTPTGAAIVSTLAESFGRMPRMRLGKVGYGAGTKVLEDRPNLLRIVLGEQDGESEQQDWVEVVETNIDDMNPELFGFVMERLFEDGALDVACIPVFMKKNRPGTMIQVLCCETNRDTVIRRILSETTALGVRAYRAERRKLPRKIREAATPYGTMRVKEVVDPDGRIVVTPEYEDCRRVALQRGIPLKKVYETIVRETSR